MYFYRWKCKRKTGSGWSENNKWSEEEREERSEEERREREAVNQGRVSEWREKGEVSLMEEEREGEGEGRGRRLAAVEEGQEEEDENGVVR